MGDGSRHSQRSDAARDARAGTTGLLSGGYAQSQNQPTRKEVAGSAVAKGARLGRGETVSAHEGELYVLAKSEGRQAKENAMRRKRLVRLLRKLRVMRTSLPKRDQLLLRIGAAKKEAGRAFGFVKIQIPNVNQAVTRKTFSFQVDKSKLKAAEQRDGHYLLRSNLTGEDPAVLWTRYVQLTQIESVFRSLKSELGIGANPHTPLTSASSPTFVP